MADPPATEPASRSSRSTAARRARRRPGPARRVPVHARAVPGHVPRRGRGRCASTPGSPRPRRRTSASATCSRAGRPASRSRSTCRRSSGSTRTTRARVGEVGRTGVAIDSLDDMRAAVRRDPARRGLDVDDDQRAGVAAAAALRARRRGAGRRPAGAPRHGPERHPQGVRRARELHLPAAPLDAADDRPRSRYCAERLPRWNTISISGYHIREAGSTAVQELAFTLANGIAYVRGGGRGGALAGRRSARGSPSSSTRTTTSSRRSRSSARRGGCGRRSCATASARTNPKALALRFHAQTGGSTLTAQQPENNIVRVALQALSARRGRRASRCTRTASTRRSRCRPSARRTIALRTQQILAARGRRDRHRRPARRLLLHRGAHRRARGAGARADRARSTSSAARSRRSRQASSRARSRRPRSAYQRGVEAGERSSSA